MKALAALAGHPETCAPVIHVAGSKGKGSVTGMIAAILEASGMKPARYSSPHVSTFRERITLGTVFFDETIYAAAGNELRDMVEQLPAAPDTYRILFDPSTPEGEGPTFFELMTLLFFLCARHADCDVMAVETGMGGRLDATNIVDPLVSVITAIEKEHTEYLGNTIEAIAGEKAGIIKPGRPVAVMEQQSAKALEVFRQTALDRGSPLLYFPDYAEINHVKVRTGGTSFSLSFTKPGVFPRPIAITLPMTGMIQAKNAGLAVLAAATAFPAIGESEVRTGLAGFSLPARFERLLERPPVIIDGAHTPASIALTADTFRSLYGDGGILLFGCAAGKDAQAMARLLVPCFSRIIITTPGSFKISFPEKVYQTFDDERAEFEKHSAGEKPVLSFIKETSEAIETAVHLAQEHSLPLLAAGSFYLAAEVRSHPAIQSR
jgi:dihydrofolate synthase/folylpolyglutamate synthase